MTETLSHDTTCALAKPSTLVEGWQQLGDRAEWGPGVQVGPYRLKRALGKGGMGVVWLAEQLEPLHRDVAIKIMAGTRRNVLAEAYFEIERQALAQLSHRAIAQIYDAGRLPDGALFFAMEYVPGQPLDDFQADHPLSLRMLAELFIQICQGVQHAHQRGLIHRDLKPLNILIQQVDGVVLPKIIDFGIALGASSVGTPLNVQRVVGTPAYMSPEQRHPDGRGIDARSDVYALGVVLGEALCRAGDPAGGEPRVDGASARAAVLHELGMGRDDAPTSEALLDRLRACPPELLAITARAMATEREGRYDTPSAMAEDLARWLDSRPVHAMPPGWRYTLRCMIRRNRLASAALVAVTLAVLLGAGMAFYGMTRAQTAQALAEQRRNDAERLIQFMLGDFADKLRPIGRLELLDGVSEQALEYLRRQDGGSDASRSLSRARALRTLGEVQATRQQFARAEQALDSAAKVLVLTAVDTPERIFEAAQIAYWRGLNRYRQKQFDAARTHWSDYLALALRLCEEHPGDPRGLREEAYALSNLGTLAADGQGDWMRALGYFERSAAVKRQLVSGDQDPGLLDLANSLSWISTTQLELGRVQAAWDSAREALALVLRYTPAERTDSVKRRREINFRRLLAYQASDLGLVEVARAQYAAALRLARQDVGNDPTQPRAQLLLAKTAFQWVLTQPAGHPEALTVVAEGHRAMAAISAATLPATDRRDLDALAALVDCDGATGSICRRRIVALEALAEGPALGLDSLLLASQLALKLHSLAPREVATSAARLTAIFDALPEQRRGLLRARLVRRALRQVAGASAQELDALDRQVQEILKAFHPQPD